MVSDNLSELIPRCQRGDPAAFAQVVAQTQTGMYNLAYSVLHDHEEAQDTTQDIYIRVWRGLPSFRGQARFTTWLYRIAINTSLNRRRRLRGQLGRVDAEHALDRLAGPGTDPMTMAIRREQKESLWAAVGRLPTKYRLVITLFYQQQLTYREIAELLSLPLGTVKAHLNRARHALARYLRRDQEDQDVAM